MYKIHSDFPEVRTVTAEQLEEICALPVFKKELFKDPVIIESFELIHNNSVFFLCVRSADGSEGFCGTSDRAAYLHPMLQQLILPFFIGKDARELEALIDGVYVTGNNYKLAGLALWCCISWVEAAMLDLMGKISNRRAGELISDFSRDEINIYVASGNRGTTPEEETEILDRRVAETGAKAIKFKVGGRMSKNADSMAGRSENLLHMTRKHFGDNMIIHADGNGSYDAEHGIMMGKICQEINAYFYEEPCPFDDLWATKAVADALDIPLAFGEQETSLRRFQWIIENDAAQVIQPDLQYNGGLIRTTKVARMAQAAGKLVTPHVSGGFPSVYMLHFIGCTPNAGKYHEYKHYDDCFGMFSPPLTPKNGKLRIPQGIGLGIELDGKVLRKGYKIFEIK